MTELAVYLDCLFGAEPDGLADVRFKLRDGHMGQDFIAVRDRDRLQRLIRARGDKTDLWVGVAPRRRQSGSKDAIEHVHALFVDCDDEAAIAALEDFKPKPSMVVASGNGRHAYWSLFPPASPDEAERANKKLIAALGADARAYDAARILRPPGTFNFKDGTPKPVTLEVLNVEVYTVDQVVGHLPEPQVAAPRSTLVQLPRRAPADPLAGVPPDVYVEALTGRVVGRDRKIVCPFHRTPIPRCTSTSARRRPEAPPDGSATGAGARATSSPSAPSSTESSHAGAASMRSGTASCATSWGRQHDREARDPRLAARVVRAA
jgi:hypothetical protein